MKRIMILLTIGAVIITACHKKAVPVVTARTEFPEPPKPAQPTVATVNTPEFLAAGKTIYEMRCNRCHDIKAPDTYSAERWPSILKSMIPKAKLNEEQANQLTAYVMANTKK